jgi:CTP:molybdopterin cytidylyltransferase MocA
MLLTFFLYSFCIILNFSLHSLIIISYSKSAHRPAGCIVLPCDQPRLTAGVLATLIERFRDGGFSAVACTYGGTTGSPVLFAPELFDRLAALTGDSGAKRVLRGCSTLQVVDFPGGDLDIDTDADLRLLKEPDSGAG